MIVQPAVARLRMVLHQSSQMTAGATLLLVKLLHKCTVGGLALHEQNTHVRIPADMSHGTLSVGNE